MDEDEFLEKFLKDLKKTKSMTLEERKAFTKNGWVESSESENKNNKK